MRSGKNWLGIKVSLWRWQLRASEVFIGVCVFKLEDRITTELHDKPRKVPPPLAHPGFLSVLQHKGSIVWTAVLGEIRTAQF